MVGIVPPRGQSINSSRLRRLYPESYPINLASVNRNCWERFAF